MMVWTTSPEVEGCGRLDPQHLLLTDLPARGLRAHAVAKI